jgi:hypothetical protein
MPPTDPRQLVPGFTTGALTRSESDHLMSNALADQALFDELMEAEPVRQALGDPVFRSKLKAELRERRLAEGLTIGERMRRFFLQPWVLPAVSLALTALIVFAVRQGMIHKDSPVVQVALPASTGEVLRAAGILEVREGEPERLEQVRRQPAQRPAAGSVITLSRTGDNSVYRVGEPMRIGFRVPMAANIMVIEERADGSVARLFPNKLQSSSRVEAGESVVIPPVGQGDLEVAGAPGRRMLKVLVFPPEVDPMDFTQPWDSIAGKATVLTKPFEVTQ